MDKGCVFDIKHFAVHDGPGVRSTVFFKGCPLRCIWCHSPESQNPYPEIAFYHESCISCGACIEACPTGAQKSEGERVKRELCTVCGKCVDVCYPGALVKIGEYVTVEHILKELGKDVLLYNVSLGGVTLSGGEPTAQPSFLNNLLKSLRDRGYHVALDTCGHVVWKVFKDLLKNVDLLLFDLKHMDPVYHEKLTGVSNKVILSNLRNISKMEKNDLIVRIPVIPGYNDSYENMVNVSHFLSNLERVETVVLLPYHDLGIRKYETLHREYPLKGLRPPELKELESIKELIEVYGLNVVVEGSD